MELLLTPPRPLPGPGFRSLFLGSSSTYLLPALLSSLIKTLIQALVAWAPGHSLFISPVHPCVGGGFWRDPGGKGAGADPAV